MVSLEAMWPIVGFVGGSLMPVARPSSCREVVWWYDWFCLWTPWLSLNLGYAVPHSSLVLTKLVMKWRLVSFPFGKQNKQKAKLIYPSVSREYKFQNPGAGDPRKWLLLVLNIITISQYFLQLKQELEHIWVQAKSDFFLQIVSWRGSHPINHLEKWDFKLFVVPSF